MFNFMGDDSTEAIEGHIIDIHWVSDRLRATRYLRTVRTYGGGADLVATTQKSFGKRLASLAEKIERQRDESQKALQHAQAALKHSQASRQHFLDLMHKVRGGKQ